MFAYIVYLSNMTYLCTYLDSIIILLISTQMHTRLNRDRKVRDPPSRQAVRVPAPFYEDDEEQDAVVPLSTPAFPEALSCPHP